MADSQGSTGTLRAGVAVIGITLLVPGPVAGLSPAWIVVFVGGGLVALSVDAANWQGMGGHVLAERCRVERRGCVASQFTRPGIC